LKDVEKHANVGPLPSVRKAKNNKLTTQGPEFSHVPCGTQRSVGGKKSARGNCCNVALVGVRGRRELPKKKKRTEVNMKDPGLGGKVAKTKKQSLRGGR